MFFKRRQKRDGLSGQSISQTQDNTTANKQKDTLDIQRSVVRSSIHHLSKHTSKIYWGLGVAFLLVFLTGLFSILYTKTYKVGNQTFTNKDIAKIADSLKRASGGQKTSGKEKEAEDRAVLLAALKSEADKHKVAYDRATINTYIEKEVYKPNGGKNAYLSYLKSAYNWDEEDLYQNRSIEYLKSKLSRYVLQNRSYVVAYARWDNFRSVKKIDATFNADEAIADKEAYLNQFIQPMKAGSSLEDLAKLTDIQPSTSSIEVTRIYQQNISPVHILIERPGNLKYDAYDEGEKVNEKLLTVKNKGEVVGPFKGADGRLIVARLEYIDGGAYANWDDYVAAVRREAGLN